MTTSIGPRIPKWTIGALACSWDLPTSVRILKLLRKLGLTSRTCATILLVVINFIVHHIYVRHSFQTKVQ